MEYQFAIAFKRQFVYYNLHTLKFTYERDDIVESLVERYGKEDLVVFLKEFLHLFTEEPKTQEISNLSEEQLREEVQCLLSENSHLKSAKQSLENQVSQLSESRANAELRKLRDENQRLSRELTNERNRNSQYATSYKDADEYRKISARWSQLFPRFRTLDELANHIDLLKTDKDKLEKSKQNSDRQVQELEQELQETEQKLSLATMRLRGLNTHPELVGESRSDQLKNEFSHIKSTLHEVSSIVLNGWQSQGFKSKARSDFKSEEFFTIKSILSRRVFGDGMNYFAQDKTEVDTELHLIMDALSSIKDFSPTPAIFHEIQEKVHVGLLRAKGVDHSDEAIEQYIEETTQRIDQDLKLIANLETTSEALGEIKKFVEAGLKIVRDIVNDANSGELFIPENGTTFDDNAHDTRDDHQGLIKMTICAGYRIKGTILVKADVMTHEPEPTSPTEPQGSDPQLDNPQIPEGGTQEPQHPGGDASKVEETENTSELPSGQSESPSPLSSGSEDHSESSGENPAPSEPEKSFGTFKGKVTCRAGLAFRYSPRKEAKAGLQASYNAELDFEGWIFGEPWKETISPNQELDNRWYKLAGQQDYWLPAFHIEGEPPSDLPPMESTGGEDEAQ